MAPEYTLNCRRIGISSGLSVYVYQGGGSYTATVFDRVMPLQCQQVHPHDGKMVGSVKPGDLAEWTGVWIRLSDGTDNL